MTSGLLLSLATAACFVTGALSVALDNGLVGSPEVECLGGAVQLVFTTENTFNGIAYSKGRYLEEACSSRADGSQSGHQVRYNFGECGVTRRRSLEPPGVFVTGTVVLQFHPFVLTKIDRAVRFQCFYMEVDKTVNQDIEVSAITTEFQTFQVPMPVCRYDIVDESGQPIKFATIGQKVTHVWVCDTDTQDVFCMEVYGCYVNNIAISTPEEEEDTIRLLDDDGCALDGNLLQNPDYDDSETDGARGLSASKETHVFKYADRPSLYFNCQIRIGVRDPGATCGEYREQTGGICADAPLTRRRRRETAAKDLGFIDVAPKDPLYIADLELTEKDIPAALLHPYQSSGARSSEDQKLSPVNEGFCVSHTFFGVLLTVTGIFVVASISMGVMLCNRNEKL